MTRLREARHVERPATEEFLPRGRGDPVSRWSWLLVVVLLGQMAVAMVTTAVEQSPTIDEPVYVGTAAVYLEQHSLRYNPEHPPLGKLIIAAGLAFTGVRIDAGFSGNQTDLGRHVLYEAGNSPGELLLAARLPVIVLTLLFGLVVFLFAADLAGRAGGLVALTLYVFSPDVIAHGSLATLDVPVAGFLLTSVWLLWRARRQVCLLPLAGLAFGAALATKMSALAAVPVVVLLAVLSVRRFGGPAVRGIGAAALIAVAVVWMSYVLVDPWLQWERPSDLRVAHGVRALAGWLPLPAPYRDGMQVQFGFEDRVWGGYLFGTHYSGSRWYYLPAALLVKTPLGALALWLVSAAVLVRAPRLRPVAVYLLVPVAVLLAVAMTGSRDLGVRYVIFVPLFLAVAAGATVALRPWWVTVLLLALVAVSSVRAFPYYLPYSNEAFGGPARTHLRLHDSNVDWGQDLGRLAERLTERHPGARVWLVYKGAGVPSSYGIEATSPVGVPPDQVRGLLVVSDSAIAKADDRLRALIDGSTRIDHVGHSITIYRRPP